ncbi:MAG: P44/Msp2 family outer membrane protein [Anaplasma sp.]
MACRGLFAAFCLAGVALAGGASASEAGGLGAWGADAGAGAFYVGAQYKPAAPIVRGFIIRRHALAPPRGFFRLRPGVVEYGTLEGTPLYMAMQRAENFESGYTPAYEANFYGFSGVIGCSKGETRVELEAAYEDFKTKKPSGQPLMKNGHEYFAVGEKSATEVVPISPKPGYMVVSNRAISSGSAILNICRDFSAGATAVPYVCLGGGAEFLGILGAENTRFAYQAKAGVSFGVSPGVSVVAAGYYRGTLKRPVRALPATEFNTTAGDTGSGIARQNSLLSAEGSVDVGYLGVELGVRVAL